MKHLFLPDTKTFLRAWPCAAVLLLLSWTVGFAQSGLSVAPENAKVGQASLYKFKFGLPDSLPSAGAVSLTFPPGFDLSRVLIAASSTINGGLRTEVVGRQVVVFRAGEGRGLAKGERVDLFISLVRNPPTAARANLQLFLHQDGVKLAEAVRKNEYRLDKNAPALRGAVTLTLDQ